MTWVAGVDGCRAGWFAALLNLESGEWCFHYAASLAAITDAPQQPKIIAIDMPMGFLEQAEPGGRACEREARRLLKGKTSSVFAVPVRAVLASPSYVDALAANRASSDHGLGLSKQAWHLVPKMCELDALLASRASLRKRVFEAHPELAFARLNKGTPVLASKKTEAGRRTRLALLAAAGFQRADARWTEHRTVQKLRRADVADDDAYDALAVCVTARRIALHDAIVLPSKPGRDARGIEMAVRY
jgi:predicted RNase H-like nuclease